MARDDYVEIPWTLQVPIRVEYLPTATAEIGQLVDFDCTLSFLNGRLEGVFVTLERAGKTFEHEIGDQERDRVLRSIWNAAVEEVQSPDSRLKYEVADASETPYERHVARLEHDWEVATGR